MFCDQKKINKNKNFWTDKYYPKTSNDILCNKWTLNRIKKWLNNYSINKNDIKQKTCLLVSGAHGVGKTSMINVLLTEMEYEVKIVDFSKLETTVKENEDSIYKYMKSNDIVKMIKDNKMKKTAILIEDIDSLTIAKEQNFIKSLQTINDVKRYCPIILTSTEKYTNFLKSLSSRVDNIKVYSPKDEDLLKILKIIINEEKIKIKVMSVARRIIEYSQYDIRRLINTLQDIKNAFGDKEITNKIFDDYCLMTKQKDENINLFEITERLLTKKTNIDESLKYYEMDKSIIPIMIQENYMKIILDNNKSDQNSINKIYNISKSLSYGDQIYNTIFRDQKWELEETFGFFSCSLPSFIINKEGNSFKKPRISFLNNKGKMINDNKERQKKLKENFANYNSFDYLNLVKLVRIMLKKDIEKCRKLLKDYNLDIENLELILKLDKIIEGGKDKLTLREKKDLFY